MTKTIYFCFTLLLATLVSCTNTPKQVNEEANHATSISDASLTDAEEEEILTAEEERTKTIDEPVAKVAVKKTNIASTADMSEVTAKDEIAKDMMVKKSYLILQSTTSYSAAMNTAKKASEQLGATLDLRGYVFDFKAGLRATEACGCGEMHGYVPRGRSDDGDYVSIEHSSGINGFTEGLYIVVAGSGKRSTLNPIQKKAQAFYADAYIKDAEVYIGCMH
jgi:hypothetical protein